MISPSLGVIRPEFWRTVLSRVSNILISELRRKRTKKTGSSEHENLNCRGSDQVCMQTGAGPFAENILWDSGAPAEGQFTVKVPWRLQSLGSIQKILVFVCLFVCLFFFFQCLFLREKNRAWVGGGAESEGDTESEAGSRLRAVSREPDTGIKLTNHKIMTWAKVGCLIDRATQAPLNSEDLVSAFASMSLGGLGAGQSL